MMDEYIVDKALAGERIWPQKAIELYNSADFLKVIAAARESVKSAPRIPQSIRGIRGGKIFTAGFAELSHSTIARHWSRKARNSPEERRL
jgi:hypothetical protein